MKSIARPVGASSAREAFYLGPFARARSYGLLVLLGMLGWDNYDGKVEFLTELFASSGTGQVNAVFPLPA